MARSSVSTDVLDRMLRVRLSKSPFRWLRTRTAQTPDTGSSDSRVVGHCRAQAASVSLGPPTHGDRVPVQFARHLLAASRLKLGATPFDVLRFALAALLLTAAGLKAYQLATEPVLEIGLLHSRPLLIATVEFELFLAVWLISGAYPRALWWTTLVCFIGFAQITLYRGLTGEASCGCLGSVEVNPWYMFLLNTAVVTLLLCFKRATRSEVRIARGDRRRLAAVLVLTLIVGIPAGAAIVRYEPNLLRLGEDPISGKSFVLLEPETWVGAKFPLFSQIGIGRQLRRGNWAVLLFRRDCPKCQKELRHLRERVQQFMGMAQDYRICLVEVPPFGRSSSLPMVPDDQVVFGRLNASREWFIQTPSWIDVRESSVFAGSSGG